MTAHERYDEQDERESTPLADSLRVWLPGGVTAVLGFEGGQVTAEAVRYLMDFLEFTAKVKERDEELAQTRQMEMPAWLAGSPGVLEDGAEAAAVLFQQPPHG